MTGRRKLAIVFAVRPPEELALILNNFLDAEEAWAIAQEFWVLSSVPSGVRSSVALEFEEMIREHQEAVVPTVREGWLSDNSLKLSVVERHQYSVETLLTSLVKLPPEIAASLFNALTQEALRALQERLEGN